MRQIQGDHPQRNQKRIENLEVKQKPARLWEVIFLLNFNFLVVD